MDTHEQAPEQASPDHEKYPLLTREDLSSRTFDSQATDLVLRFQLAGWRGFFNRNGHVFLMAPDGKTTTSVSRSSLRGRSGRNAEAKLKAWNRQRRRQEPEPTRDTAFGDVKFVDPYPNGKMPVRALNEMKQDAALRDYWTANPERRSELPLMGPDDVWAMFDVASPIRLVTFSPRWTSDEAWALLATEAPELFAINESAGERDVQIFVCEIDECGKRFEGKGEMARHQAVHHSGPVKCDHPGCDFVAVNAAGLGGHRRAHRVKPPAVVEVPGAGVVGEPERGTSGEGRDVLMEHLMSMPSGGQAEALLAQVRSVVAAPLVEEIRQLRADNARMREEIDKLTADKSEFEARLSLLREAMAI